MAILHSKHGIPTSNYQMTQTHTDEGDGFTAMASPKSLGILFFLRLLRRSAWREIRFFKDACQVPFFQPEEN
jgi:hypothetical protein